MGSRGTAGSFCARASPVPPAPRGSPRFLSSHLGGYLLGPPVPLSVRCWRRRHGCFARTHARSLCLAPRPLSCPDRAQVWFGCVKVPEKRIDPRSPNLWWRGSMVPRTHIFSIANHTNCSVYYTQRARVRSSPFLRWSSCTMCLPFKSYDVQTHSHNNKAIENRPE